MNLARTESGTAHPDGITLVFLHGAGMGAWMWEPQTAAFADRRCLAFDLPDHGGSRGIPFDTIPAVARTLAAEAEDWAAGQSVVLVGHSLGAKVALQMLADQPGRYAGALVASALSCPSALARMMASPGLIRLSLRMLENPGFAAAQADSFAFTTHAARAAFLEETRQTSSEGLARVLAAFAAADRPPAGLSACPCPVLALAGGSEPRAMRRAAAGIAAVLPQGQAALLPGQRHNYPWAAAAAFNGHLADLLARVGPPAQK